MSNKNKIIVAISIGFVLAIIGIGVSLYFSNKETPAPAGNNKSSDKTPNQTGDNNVDGNGQQATSQPRTIEDFNEYIVQNEKSLVDPTTNIPVFTILKSSEPLPGWHVLTLRNNEEDTSDATLVLREVDGTLTTVAGPGTGIFNQADLPIEVRNAARKELQ